ncbi:MAG: CDP-glycerol glycerophosphotransferase family protein, partial [Candidatus Limnocylindrales bacterium]
MAAARAELVSLRWERIQVLIRLTPVSPSSIETLALRLHRTDDPASGMPATRAWSEDGDIVGRFNVMLGPGGVPFEPGHWVLAADAPGAEQRPLEVAGPASAQLPGARFETERGTYEVLPSIVAGQLQLDVRLQPFGSIGARRARSSRTLPIRIVRALGVAGFALLYKLARLASRRDPTRILFLGHYGTDLSGDMQAVLARMTERGIDRERPVAIVRPMRSRGVGEWLRLPLELARAGTIVIEEDVLYMISPVEARVIQLWHASGALKTIGFSRIGKPSARSPWSRHYKDFTYAIVSGEHDVPLFAEAFGMPENRVLPLGHPRMDRFFDESWRAQARESTLRAFPMARGRRVILFAPTWRAYGAGRVYDLSVLDYARLHALCVEIDAVFIIRL